MGRLSNFFKAALEENRAYYERQSIDAKHPKPAEPKQAKIPQTKVPVLINSRVCKEDLPKEQWKCASDLIEEEMNCFPCLPFQICNCSYIGENTAWATYNMTNKRCLQPAINELNYLLADVVNLDDTVSKIIPQNYFIDFKSICFDYSDYVKYGDLPRSYMLYRPKTKSGKLSRFPLIAFFNTIKNSPSEKSENYIGELCYSVNGELCEAKLHCWKHGKFAEFEFSTIGRTFMISKIRTHGADGKLFLLYDCMWKFTDYIDFT